jgi:hypothetical protein
VRKKTKKSTSESRLSLAKGQVWKTTNLYVQIVELGKILVHYKLLEHLSQIRSVQMSRIEILEEYLEANKARLLEAVV